MLITCNCLNIIVSSANNLPLSLANVNDSNQQRQYNVSSIETVQHQPCTINKIKGDHLQFFESAKGPVTCMVATVQHEDLEQVIAFDEWNAHLCINCKKVTHAHSTNDKNTFLINPLLLTNQEEINVKKSHEHFSKTFEIVIQQNSKEIILTENSDKHANLSARSKNLKGHLRDVIQKEIQATDERVRRYTEHQTALLKNFREKAEQDFQNVLSVLSNVPELEVSSGSVHNQSVCANTSANAKLLSDLDTPPVTPDSTPMSIGNSPNFKQQPAFMTNANNGLNINKSPKIKPIAIQHSSPYQSLNLSGAGSANADADIFFEMEGLDGPDPRSENSLRPQQRYDHRASSYDNADEDDDDNNYDSIPENDVMGVKISSSSFRQPRPRVCIAQSLPMAVPIQFSQRQDEDYEEYTDDNVDIAASIKALAKSVHGEAVFGDLPRPRFSTQI